MKTREPYELPPPQQTQLSRAIRLQWTSLGAQASTVIAMAFAMGSSQAMRSAWAEDVLSLVPPIAFLISVRVRRRPPDASYPYGRHRVVSIAHLVAAVALFALGLWLAIDSILSLVRGEHATIGYLWVAGHQVWLGYVMMLALAYSMVPPVVLGSMKLPLARALHAKVLYADATMNKDDWMTALAAIAGIVGIGLGLWWADAVAAGLISCSVLKDGTHALRTVLADLMDHAPRPVDKEEKFDLEGQLAALLASVEWVADYEIRLREEGDVCVGEVFVVPTPAVVDLTSNVEQLAQRGRALDWRIYDLVVTPVRSLSSLEPPAGH